MVAYFFAPQVIFLSTLSLRRATVYKEANFPGFAISIHALLAESDIDKRCKFSRDNRISIHALLAESDGHPSRIPWR